MTSKSHQIQTIGLSEGFKDQTLVLWIGILHQDTLQGLFFDGFSHIDLLTG